MKNLATIILLVIVAAGIAMSQPMTLKAINNVFELKQNWTGPDSLKPYLSDQGVRTVWVTKDLDKDGKPEILATDYSNRGRVHVFEMTSPGVLELVWSSPRRQPSGGGSTPRWVRDGDLDGDGNREIIFPWSLASGADSAIEVYEWTGIDNDYGTERAFTLEKNIYASQGVGNFRTNREVGEVYDFDSDGRDELVMTNRDNKVYILGVVGEFPGYGSWQLEGGDPVVNPENKFSGGSHWHSVPADIDGDGKKEIVNHYWNFWGYWSIDPVGPDTYRYPTPGVDSLTNDAAKTQYYREYFPEDAVSYMGVVPVDVDGDGKEEIGGVIYVGGSDFDYDVVLTSLSKQDTGVYVWRDGVFGTIGSKLWELAGKSAGSHWGTAAYDFNGNGRQEYLVGGSGEYELISLEYNGTGSVLDGANYSKTIVYPGDKVFYHFFDYYDSLGTRTDTVYRETPFLAKVFAGSDLDNNGKKEAVLAYQSIADSVTYTYYTWDTTLTPKRYVLDHVEKTPNANAVNIRVVEWTGSTGFEDKHITFVTPEDYRLEQNYPNPFNPSTTIEFSLPVNKKISLIVYDMLGQEVKRVIDGQEYEKGTHVATWNGTDNHGKPVASGNYVYTLKFGNFTKSAKMTLVK